MKSIKRLRADSNALADVLCWFAGYKAAGGDPDPVNLEHLQLLKCEIDAQVLSEQVAELESLMKK